MIVIPGTTITARDLRDLAVFALAVPFIVITLTITLSLTAWAH